MKKGNGHKTIPVLALTLAVVTASGVTAAQASPVDGLDKNQSTASLQELQTSLTEQSTLTPSLLAGIGMQLIEYDKVHQNIDSNPTDHVHHNHSVVPNASADYGLSRMKFTV